MDIKKNSTKFHCFTTLDNEILKTVNFSSGNNNDYNTLVYYEDFFKEIQEKIKDRNVYLLADSGYDTKKFRALCSNYGLIPIVGINNRNAKIKRVMSDIEEEIYKKRCNIEKTFAWIKSFYSVRLRTDIKYFTWKSKVFLTTFMINLRNVTV